MRYLVKQEKLNMITDNKTVEAYREAVTRDINDYRENFNKAKTAEERQKWAKKIEALIIKVSEFKRLIE